MRLDWILLPVLVGALLLPGCPKGGTAGSSGTGDCFRDVEGDLATARKRLEKGKAQEARLYVEALANCETAWQSQDYLDVAGRVSEELGDLNGAWRADNSPGGLFADYIWEDSVSRDMLIGWAAAFGAAWEVIREDGTIPAEVKDRLREDARALGTALTVVGASGYDLEVPDADGRVTLHGWLNEHNLDGQFYAPTIENGFHAVMALGIVAAYAYASEDPALRTYLYEQLIAERELPRITRDTVALLTDLGWGSNFSNYNMAFTGFWLAFRYIEDPGAREILRAGVRDSLYARPDRDFQPIHIHYSLYDFVYAAGLADASAHAPTAAPFDAAAVGNGLDTLEKFAAPPYWDARVVNCPEMEACTCTADACWCPPEVSQGICVAADGVTELTRLGCWGWKCGAVVAEPLPWELQRPSNYHWRSAPHQPNGGGGGGGLLPGVDFRFAYWLGRWTRAAE